LTTSEFCQIFCLIISRQEIVDTWVSFCCLVWWHLWLRIQIFKTFFISIHFVTNLNPVDQGHWGF
jgi:hypothetical protein